MTNLIRNCWKEDANVERTVSNWSKDTVFLIIWPSMAIR